MPTKRRRVTRDWEAPISDAMLAYLETGVIPKGDDYLDVLLATRTPEPRTAWETVREALLADWIRRRPGSRPWAWWEFDAPRWLRQDWPARCRDLGDWVTNRWAEPRRRLGGVGTPSYEVLNILPEFDRGVPIYWVSQFDVDYYNGRARDIHGSRIGTNYRAGNFIAQAFDAHDPPRYESEAAYLNRHGVLTQAERRSLPPEAFEIERVSDGDDAA